MGRTNVLKGGFGNASQAGHIWIHKGWAAKRKEKQDRGADVTILQEEIRAVNVSGDGIFRSGFYKYVHRSSRVKHVRDISKSFEKLLFN